MKSKRQEKILELIADHSVQTQEQLLAELNEAGFSTHFPRHQAAAHHQGAWPKRCLPLCDRAQACGAHLLRQAEPDLPAVHHERGLRTEHDRRQDHARTCKRRRLRNRQAEHPGNARDACGRRYVLRCAEGHAGRCRALRRDPGADRALRPERNRRKTDAFYPAYRKYCRDRTGRDRL